MDSLIASAARELAAGDPFSALKRIALRDDPPALALRGIAMAQLNDYERARKLLRRAARGFGTHERLAQARCQVAEAEVALAARDLSQPIHLLNAAAQALEMLGDRTNALHARLVTARRHLLVGELAAAEQTLATVDIVSDTPAPLVARAELTLAECALRRIRITDAIAALERAHAAAVATGIPPMIAEVSRVRRVLSVPSARLIGTGVTRPVRLDEVEALFASDNLVVDACRRVVRTPARSVSLAGRPILFALASALAEAWPADVRRDHLIERVFRARVANESHRVRLRVELSRLRSALHPLVRIEATPLGYTLAPINAPAVIVLVPPIDGPAGTILALLEGGESWSTSALARALGMSQRSVQRALRHLEEASAIRTIGRGRTRRWLAPALSGFATNLLLPGSLPVD